MRLRDRIREPRFVVATVVLSLAGTALLGYCGVLNLLRSVWLDEESGPVSRFGMLQLGGALLLLGVTFVCSVVAVRVLLRAAPSGAEAIRERAQRNWRDARKGAEQAAR